MCSILILPLTVTCLAQDPTKVFVWDGGGGSDHNFTNAANWVGDAAPVPGTSNIFVFGTQNPNPKPSFAGTFWGTTIVRFTNDTVAFDVSGGGSNGIANTMALGSYMENTSTQLCYIGGGLTTFKLGDSSVGSETDFRVTQADGRLIIYNVIADGDGARSRLIKSGPGKMWLDNGFGNDNTYTGETIINGGRLRMGKAPDGVIAIPGDVTINSGGSLDSNFSENIADTSVVTINNGGRYTLSLQSHVTETVRAIESSQTDTNGVVSIGDGGNLILQPPGVSTFYGVIEQAAGTTNGTLTMQGTGRYETLNGSNSVHNLAVNSGTLVVSNNWGTGTVTVNSNGTLLGTGTIAGALTVNAGGNISAGVGAGALTLTNGLNLSNDGKYLWELADNTTNDPGVNFDQISLTGGSLVLGGASKLSIRFTGTATAPDISNPFWQSSHTWTIASLSGSATNPGASNFSTVENGSYPAGNFTTAVDGGNVLLSFAPNPGGCQSPPNGLVSWWPGDGFALDVVSTNHGTLQHGAWFAPGRVGQAFSLTGAGEYLRLPDDFFPFPFSGTDNQPFSIATWFKTTSGGVIFGQQSGEVDSSPSGWVAGLWVGTDGLLRAELFWNGSANPVTSAAAVNDGLFHHAAVVYDGTNQVLYLDSVLVGAVAHSQAGYASSYRYQLGTGYTSGWPGGNGGWYSFNGLIDEAAFFNRALSSNEIVAVYAAGSGGLCYTNDPAPVFVRQPASQTVIEARGATFTSAAMGTPRPCYQWLFSGNPLPLATNATLILTNLALNQAGDYCVIASNVFGAVTSAVAQLVVIEDFNLPGKTATNCTAKPPGLVAWWPGDGFAFDVLGTNHGTLQSGATYGAGKVGQAFLLDGVNGYVGIPASSNLDVGTGDGFSIDLWLYPSNVANHPLVEWYSSSGYGVHLWIYPEPGQLHANLVDTAGGYHYFNSASGALVPNALQHVALTYDKMSGVARLFRNAAVVGESLLGSFTPQTSHPLYLGHRPGYSAPFSGSMDEVSIYNRALSSNEVAILYAAGSGGKCFTSAPAPVFVQHPASQTGVLLNSVAFTAAAMGVPRPEYQWLFNGVPLANGTNATLSLNNLSTNQAGDYALVASNLFGNSTSTTAHLEVVLPAIVSGVESFELGWGAGRQTTGFGRWAYRAAGLGAHILERMY